MLNLDTHILVFALTDQLSTREQKLLDAQPWSISAIVLWELAKLIQLGRLGLELQDAELNRVLSTIRVWPITWEICQRLALLDFKSDPADELIAATSWVHGIPLLTRDRTLLKSRLIPLAR